MFFTLLFYLLSSTFLSPAYCTDFAFDMDLYLLKPLSVNNTSDIVFPEVIKGLASSITSDQSGVGGLLGHSASFSVTGEPMKSYTISGYSNGLPMHGPSGKTITASLTITGGDSRALDSSGEDSFQVKGQVLLDDTCLPGSYDGSISLVMSYN
jgi:hypothetical protein